MSRSAKHDHTVPGKRSRSPGPRFEAGAAPPPSLLHAVVAAQGILPSEVSIHSPRTEQPRKPEPRTSGSRPSRKLQYPGKEVDQDENGGDDVAEEVERDAAMPAMPTALPSPRSVALQRMALLQQEVDQIKRVHGRPAEYDEEGRYKVEAIRGRRVRKGATEAAVVDAPGTKRTPRRGRSSEAVGALSTVFRRDLCAERRGG